MAFFDKFEGDVEIQEWEELEEKDVSIEVNPTGVEVKIDTSKLVASIEGDIKYRLRNPGIWADFPMVPDAEIDGMDVFQLTIQLPLGSNDWQGGPEYEISLRQLLRERWAEGASEKFAKAMIKALKQEIETIEKCYGLEGK